MNKLSKIYHPTSIIQNSSSKIKHWYAIYVRSRHEKCVHSELQNKGIESSLPMATQIRQWSDRKKKIEVPLFRGYVFVKIDIVQEKLPVIQTDGVVKFVTFCNKSVVIPEQQMYWLDQLLQSDLELEQEKDYPIGTEVEVLFGPMKGLRGRVKHKNSIKRLVIWFDAIMQGVSVEIDSAYLVETNTTKPITIHRLHSTVY